MNKQRFNKNMRAIKTLNEKWLFMLFTIYFFMSYFEGYANILLGNVTKYFIIILIIAIFVANYGRRYALPIYLIPLLFWLLLKNISLLWGGDSYLGMQVVKTHFFSQLLMCVLLTIISMVRFDKKFVYKIININMYLSGGIAVLAIFFSKAYHETYTARMTLTIFGIQMDPNDLSALYILGVVIALYKIIIKREKNIVNFCFVIIGSLAMGMTASRGGIVSLIAVIVLMIVITDQKLKINLITIQKLIVFGLILFACYYVFLMFLPTESLNRLFTEGYESGSGRIELWSVALTAFVQNPIIGYGWGGSYLGIHNTYLNILVDNGIIGLLLFLSSVFLIAKEAWQKEEILVIYLLAASMFPAFFIEAITKRFFWNGLILAMLLIRQLEKTK